MFMLVTTCSTTSTVDIINFIIIVCIKIYDCEAPRSKVIMLLRVIRQAMKHRPRFRKQLKVGGEDRY